MKIKEGFVLRQIVDSYVVIPLAQATISLNGMINLNHSGAMLWQLMEQGTTREALVDALLAEYEVSREEAKKDVDAFIEKLETANCIEK